TPIPGIPLLAGSSHELPLPYLVETLIQIFAHLENVRHGRSGLMLSGDWTKEVADGAEACWIRLESLGWHLPTFPPYETDPIGHVQSALPFLTKIAPYVYDGPPQ